MSLHFSMSLSEHRTYMVCTLVCYPSHGYRALLYETVPPGCFIQKLSISLILLSYHMFKTRDKQTEKPGIKVKQNEGCKQISPNIPSQNTHRSDDSLLNKDEFKNL